MSTISVAIDDQTYTVELKIPIDGARPALTAIVNGETLQVVASSLESLEQIDWVAIDDRSYEIAIDRDLRWIRSHRGRHRLELRDLEARVMRPPSGDGRVKAPIPGIITRVLVAADERVEAGQPLVVLEAMKMENEIRAPRSGTVSQLSASVGQRVALQELLAEIA